MSRGLSNAEIADRLVLSRRTVEHHVQDIYLKIGASTRAGAAMFAMQHGLLDQSRYSAHAHVADARSHCWCMLSTARGRPDNRERLVTPAFIRLAVADLAYFTSAGIAIYTLPLWVTGPVGSDKSGAGLAFGAFAISALILRPVAGRLADTRGRRPLLVGGALLSALVMLGTAYADNLVLVVLLRLLFGVGEAAFFVASLAALADLAPPSRMSEAISYNSLGLYLGLAFGPLVSCL